MTTTVDSAEGLDRTTAAAPAIAGVLADFAAGLRLDDVPPDVVEAAKLHLLDSVGLAYASGTYDFATRSLVALSSLGAGDSPVIGQRQRLAPRDAVLANGVFVHGLDYDDTHLAGVVHPSASAFPTALAVAADRRLSGGDLLLGYLIGVEVSSRLGAVAKGNFHAIGFHPTGLVGAFGCAALVGRLHGLPARGIAHAQGVVGSMAGGLLEFLDGGAWTKRMHPGWAGVAGITACALAGQGFVGPERVYEGRFGLYATHLRPDADRDLSLATAGLGEQWEMRDVAIKPYPTCHLTHAFADAALALVHRESLRPEDVRSIRCLIAEGEVGTVCEPADKKLFPTSDYDAKFSLPFIVAAAIVRRRFTLAELYQDALADPVILDLARKVSYEPDPASGFPRHYSGEVIVETAGGRTLRHREQVNRGADECPLSGADIEAKFRDNMELAAGPDATERVLDAVLSLERFDDAAAFGELLRG
ncbi:MAG: MmgE/PrpD family protein [Streptosporangiaceae bacterium]